MSTSFVVLPRPGAATDDKRLVIAAPKEEDFTAIFGHLLPQASYLQTEHGRAAYYSILPSKLASPNEEVITRVLFVHGVQTCAIGLQPLAKALSSRFPHAHCVLVDLWGHGLTDTPVVPYEPALFHSLIETLLVHLNWENAHFIGYSFGGSTTATFAVAKPHRVASMVLVAPAGLLRAETFSELVQSYVRGGEGVDEEEAQNGIIEWLEDGELVVPSDWKERVGRGEMVAQAVKDWQVKNHRGHAASVVAVFRDGGALNRHAEFAKAAQLGIKYLCVLGELDGVCSAGDLADLGMTNVVVVPQADHGVVRERVPEVAEHIEEFWNKLV